MKPITGNESKHDMRLRAHKLDRKMRSDHRHQFVSEREGESFNDALTRTRMAMVAWCDHKTLLAQMATGQAFCKDEKEEFELEAEMDEVRDIIKGLEDGYVLVKRLAIIRGEDEHHRSAIALADHKAKRASMTEQELAESKANVERMEAVYHKEYPNEKDFTTTH